MEGNLVKTLFRRLLEVLRLERPPESFSGTDPRSKRRVESFEALSDGLKIRGSIYFPVSRPSKMYPVMVLCHGIPGSGAPRPADDPGYEGLAQEFADLGLAAVIFNFRGCGDSDGDFDMMGWTRDLDAVLDKILNYPHVDPTRLLITGFSGGGAAATCTCADNEKIYALAVVGTPAHFRIFERDQAEVIDDFRERGVIKDPNFPSDPDAWMRHFEEVEPMRWIARFKGKYLLIVHGEEDELIPAEHARELYDRAPSGIARLELIPGGEHRLRTDRRCVDILKDWTLHVLAWKA